MSTSNKINISSRSLGLICVLVLICFSALFYSCSASKCKQEEPLFTRDWDEIVKNGELLVLISYGPLSYFTHRGTQVGHQYELVRRFARDMNLELRVKAVPKSDLYEMLLEGQGDLIAYRMPITEKSEQNLLFIDNKKEIRQVLVQALNDTMISSVDELVGKKVYVLANTNYEQTLSNLNEKLGGGIEIYSLSDSIGVSRLIDKVSLRRIPFTVAGEDIALLSNNSLRNLNLIPISYPQPAAWAVRNTSPVLQEKLNEWFSSIRNTRFYRTLHYRYYRNNEYFSGRRITLYQGRYISPYDHLFRQYAKKINWDWRLLASIAFHESTFDSGSVSSAGAIGLMQLMPQTALGLGFEEEELFYVENNIRAAVKYLQRLDHIFRRVEDKSERIKFVLAAYNAGLGHVIDAMALAEEFGKERHIWDGNVEIYMRLKSNPIYYNHPVVNHGFCRGDDVVNYVENVITRFQRYKNVIRN